METFPFTAAEWKQVIDSTHPLMEARLAEDNSLAEAKLKILRSRLLDLKNKYGEHPILLETEADFVEEASEAKSLYERALSLAKENSLPIASISISYAYLVFAYLEDPKSAQEILESCRDEVYDGGDESIITEHEDLMAMVWPKKPEKGS